MLKMVLKQRKLIILFLYSASYGLMLLNNGIFWDDWTLYNMDSQVIFDIYHDQGHRWLGYLHNFLLSLDEGILCYRIIVFSAYLAAALLLDEILKTASWISDGTRLLIVLIFALFPVNNVRFLLINTPYAICYVCFYAACWFLLRYQEKGKVKFRLAALLFFFMSFDTNSMLVFYIIPVLYLFKDCFRLVEGRIRLISTPDIGRQVDFLVLPLLYWLPKAICFAPLGAWEGYNAITAGTLLRSPIFLMMSFYTSFLKVIDYACHGFNSLVLAGALAAGLILGRRGQLSINTVSGGRDSGKKYLYLFWAGVTCFVLAVLPYNVVGLLPKLDNWHSRHQLLVPLGASIMLVCGGRAVMERLGINDFAKTIIWLVILCLFVCTNINDCVNLHIDWFKQQALVESFRENEVLFTNSTFLVKDEVVPEWGINRIYPVYQYAGMLKLAFGNEKRIGINVNSMESGDYNREISQLHKYFGKKWNAGDYVMTSPQYLVIVKRGTYKVDRLSKVLSLKRNEWLHPSLFKKRLRDMIRVDYQRL